MPNNKNIRKCIVCHEHADKIDLIRFVRTKDGKIFKDESKSSDGRGVWIHNNSECLEKLIKKRLLNAAFKTSVSDELYEGLLNG